MADLHHHPDGDDRFYGPDEAVYGLKPLAGLLLSILALPIFLAWGMWRGLLSCWETIWEFGDHFYYWSKVHHWGKYTPRYRRWMREKSREAKAPSQATGGEA